MAEKKTNGTNRVHKGRTTLAYVVLIILSFLCLFFFYILTLTSWFRTSARKEARCSRTRTQM